MKKKICKKLRDKAERETTGLPASYTRGKYLAFKKEWKEKFRKRPIPKFKISKRQQRKAA